MKYRTLTPAELEAYEIGYKVGNRKIIITDIEWESETEHSIYRKGYMAGLMDYKRKVNNVSNVSNVHSYNSDMVKDKDKDKDKDKVKVMDKVKDMDMENKGGAGEKETNSTNEKKMAADAILNKFARSFKENPDGTTQIGKMPIPPLMKQFLETEFKPTEITRLKKWLAENKSGETMKNESILKAACTIADKKYPDVAFRFMRFAIK